jgi:hypothetical protein
MPETTLDLIVTIAEKHDVTNYTPGIYRHSGSKWIASNARVQTKTKQ